MTEVATPAGPTEATEAVGQLPVGLKLGWSSGALGVAMLMNGIAILIMFYLVGILKIEPALAGTIVFISKLFDVVSDPAIGLWSDQLESPRGRRRPFLLWGAIISPISFFMVFSTPLFDSQLITAAYVLFALCLYTVGYTVFNVPYMSMPAEMTDSYHERSSIHAYRIVFISIGGLIAAAIAPAVIDALGKTEWSSYAMVSGVCAVAIFLAMMTAYGTTANARHTNKTHAGFKFTDEMRAVAKNRNFLRIIGVKFAQLTGVQATQAAMLFFIVQSLQLDLSILIVFGVVTTLTTIVAAPLLVRFSRRFEKRQAYYLAAVVYVLYSLSWVVAGPGEPVWAIALRAMLVGIAATGNVVLAMSMLTDVINVDARQTGIRREGAYTALYSFVEKFTAALGPLVIGLALSLANFDTSLPPDVPQGGDVDQALLFCVAWLPAGMGLIAIWILSGYKLRRSDVEH